MSRYYDDNRRSLNDSPAIKIFLITLAIMLVVGIPTLFIIKKIKSGSSEHSFLTASWEKIPEASYAENVAITDEESAKRALEIPDEDKDYTHKIGTNDDD